MKLIGITGKSGSGKTTLANLIGEHDNVGVIHIDDLLNRFKEEMLSSIMDNDADGKPTLVKKKHRKLVYTNKYFFLTYIKLESIVLDKKIKDKIKEYEDSGKDIVVIENVYLKFFSIFKDLDMKIMLSRPYSKRLDSVLKRDENKNIDKESFVLRDIPFKKSFYKYKKEDYDMIIPNESLDKMKEKADEIYSTVNTKSKNPNKAKLTKKYKFRANPLSKIDIQTQKGNDETIR